MTTVFDDTDPNLHYSGGWRSNGQPNSNNGEYYNQTYQASSNNGDYIEVRWTGGNIAMYGSRQRTHLGFTLKWWRVVQIGHGFINGAAFAFNDNRGVYGITIDSLPIQLFSGFSNPSSFQQALFATSDLAQGDHVLRMSNENAKNVASNPGYIWVDLDFVAVSGSLRNANPNAAPPPPPPSSQASSTRPPTTAAPQSTPTPTSTQPAPSSAQSQAPPLSPSPVSLSSAISSSSPSSSSMTTAPSSTLVPSTTPITTLAHSSHIDTVVDALSATTRPEGPSVRPVAPSDGVVVPKTGDEGEGGGRTTVVAVSGTVTALSALTIITVIGLWFHRRKRQASRRSSLMQNGSSGARDYVRQDAAWARL